MPRQTLLAARGFRSWRVQSTDRPVASRVAEKEADAELVRLAQGGNERAFQALVVKYQRRIARHVARYVRRASDVEEVVQDAFIRAYRGLASFRGDASFYSWLYRIATNAEADERIDQGFEPGVTDEQSPERILFARQIADAVERAMARLQPELAEALVLFEVEGKSYQEIAQMLGTPIGTVRTRIFRAREFIARRLEPVLGPARDRRW